MTTPTPNQNPNPNIKALNLDRYSYAHELIDAADIHFQLRLRSPYLKTSSRMFLEKLLRAHFLNGEEALTYQNIEDFILATAVYEDIVATQRQAAS